jgi:hypothetical protein
MVSKLNKFLAKPEKVVIQGEEFELSPLRVEDLPLVNDFQSTDPEKKILAAYEIGYKICKQIDPEMTRDEYANMDMKFMNELMMAFLKINGVDDQEAIAKLKSNAR